jgi:thioredoxin reductase
VNRREDRVITEHYTTVIIGSGPAGISAGGRAAALDRAAGHREPTHLLVEAFELPAKTIQRYQRGKHVMAQPAYLALRSDCAFDAGSRERVLEEWGADLERLGVNVRYGAEVIGVSGERGSFSIALADGQAVAADSVVLAIGLEGNPRKLGIPGENLPLVQYHLDDPEAYENETIVVVGAGDSAIENALGLAEAGNDVVILNRRDEFSRAKEGNLIRVLNATVCMSDAPRDRKASLLSSAPATL